MSLNARHFEIRQFPCRSDNFGVIIHERSTGAVALIDSPEEAAVRRELDQAGLKLTHIFTTHSHFDHIDGYAALKRDTDCKIYGPAKEADAIPGLDVPVKDGDRLPFGGAELLVIETPGHTHGHVSFYLDSIGKMTLGAKEMGAVFVGDTLFSVGCGRVNGGAYADLWRSTARLAQLPPQTLMYCGHEYTKSNVMFALSVEPDNPALLRRQSEVEEERAAGKPTLPVTIGKELETNPFLRLKSPTIRATLGLDDATPDEQVFEMLRKRKDVF